MRKPVRFIRLGVAVAGSLSATTAAQPKEPVGWRAGDVLLKLGPAGVLFHSSAKVKVAGSEVPGGSIELSDGVTATGEFEYFPNRNISVAVVFGSPLNSTGTGTGSLASLGELGRVHYGIGGLVARYHLFSSRRFSPFVATGIGRFFAFSSKDGAVTGLHVDSAWGPVLQGGADFHFDRHFGLYFNASYVSLKTNARGIVDGQPATARLTTNPVGIQGGVSYRF